MDTESVFQMSPEEARARLAASGNWPKRTTIGPQQAESDYVVLAAHADLPAEQLDEYLK